MSFPDGQPFKNDQRARIEHDFLVDGFATCPNDGWLLLISRFDNDGPVTDLRVVCEYCKRHDEWHREPKRYRRWTDAEGAETTARRISQGFAHCPLHNCGSLVVLKTHTDSRSFAYCPGCGNDAWKATF